MAGYRCPFCGFASPIIPRITQSEYAPSFMHADTLARDPSIPQSPGSALYDNAREGQFRLVYNKCAECGKMSIFSYRTDSSPYLPSFAARIYPASNAVKFPDYVPLAIRSDYEEACAIKELSPKACATLCRRCLQGMIHDFWGVHEKNLNAEITALKSVVAPAQWKVLDSLRALGNIGAHMEHDINLIIDIDPGEADKLISLIEHLIKSWYIERHDTEQLYGEITQIGMAKQDQRRQ